MIRDSQGNLNIPPLIEIFLRERTLRGQLAAFPEYGLLEFCIFSRAVISDAHNATKKQTVALLYAHADGEQRQAVADAEAGVIHMLGLHSVIRDGLFAWANRLSGGNALDKPTLLPWKNEDVVRAFTALRNALQHGSVFRTHIEVFDRTNSNDDPIEQVYLLELDEQLWAQVEKEVPSTARAYVSSVRNRMGSLEHLLADYSKSTLAVLERCEAWFEDTFSKKLQKHRWILKELEKIDKWMRANRIRTLDLHFAYEVGQKVSLRELPFTVLEVVRRRGQWTESLYTLKVVFWPRRPKTASMLELEESMLATAHPFFLRIRSAWNRLVGAE